MKGKVVVTGMGVVTGFGRGVETLWENLLAGRSAVRPLDVPWARGFDCRSAAVFPMEGWLQQPLHERTRQMAAWALDEAVAQAGLGEAASWNGKISWVGSMGWDWPDPASSAPPLSEDILGSLIGPFGRPRRVRTCLSACAASTQGIGEAARMIFQGESDIVFAGTSDTRVDPLAMGGYEKLGVLAASGDGSWPCRPYSSSRRGFVPGEGAAFLVLESETHALARGVEPLAEIAGWAATCDAYRVTDPEPGGKAAALCVSRCLERAGVTDVEAIHGHGTGTPANDAAEAAAMRHCFGEKAAAVPLVSSKGSIGHLSMACGGVETIVAIQMARQGMIPPMPWLTDPDEKLGLGLGKTKAESRPLPLVLKNSFGFGGQNASVLVRRRSRP